MAPGGEAHYERSADSDPTRSPRTPMLLSDQRRDGAFCMDRVPPPSPKHRRLRGSLVNFCWRCGRPDSR